MVGPALHLPDRPAMPVERLARRDRSLAQLGLPVAAGQGRLDLAEDDVDHPVEEVVLVGDVVVERHRLDPELLGELAHRQLLRPALVGQGDRGAQHALSAERRPSPRGVLGLHGLVVLRRRPRGGRLAGLTSLRRKCTTYSVNLQRKSKARRKAARDVQPQRDDHPHPMGPAPQEARRRPVGRPGDRGLRGHEARRRRALDVLQHPRQRGVRRQQPHRRGLRQRRRRRADRAGRDAAEGHDGRLTRRRRGAHRRPRQGPDSAAPRARRLLRLDARPGLRLRRRPHHLRARLHPGARRRRPRSGRGPSRPGRARRRDGRRIARRT